MTTTYTLTDEALGGLVAAQFGPLPPEPAANRVALHQAYALWRDRNVQLSQYPTPLDLAHYFVGELFATDWLAGRTATLLETSAGSGALLEPLAAAIREGMFDATAYEIDPIPCLVGSRLFPQVTWYNRSPETDLAALQGRFDVVVSNPPWRRSVFTGVGELKAAYEFATWDREQLFLALAIDALRVGGRAMVLLPPNCLSQLTQEFWDWLQARCSTYRVLPAPEWSGRWQNEIVATYWERSYD
ncbi:MAG: N-6 DNA methylase [Xanthomonadales bacterium]|nr:N-6 DNA methylase [Xanthomonadales bacterium]